MRGFYLTFPIRDALRRELSRTHYRTLLRVEREVARHWYMEEAAANETGGAVLPAHTIGLRATLHRRHRLQTGPCGGSANPAQEIDPFPTINNRQSGHTAKFTKITMHGSRRSDLRPGVTAPGLALISYPRVLPKAAVRMFVTYIIDLWPSYLDEGIKPISH